MMGDMKMTSAPRLPTGDGLTVPRLVSPQQTAAPVDHSHGGGGCSPSLIRQRLNLSRAGKHNRGFGRVASRLGLADQIAGGAVSIAAAAAPDLPAPATTISALGASLSVERYSQPVSRCQQPHLSARFCRAVTNLRSVFKVRDSQRHIHIKERKKQ